MDSQTEAQLQATAAEGNISLYKNCLPASPAERRAVFAARQKDWQALTEPQKKTKLGKLLLQTHRHDLKRNSSITNKVTEACKDTAELVDYRAELLFDSNLDSLSRLVQEKYINEFEPGNWQAQYELFNALEREESPERALYFIAKKHVLAQVTAGFLRNRLITTRSTDTGRIDQTAVNKVTNQAYELFYNDQQREELTKKFLNKDFLNRLPKEAQPAAFISQFTLNLFEHLMSSRLPSSDIIDSIKTYYFVEATSFGVTPAELLDAYQRTVLTIAGINKIFQENFKNQPFVFYDIMNNLSSVIPVDSGVNLRDVNGCQVLDVANGRIVRTTQKNSFNFRHLAPEASSQTLPSEGKKSAAELMQKECEYSVRLQLEPLFEAVAKISQSQDLMKKKAVIKEGSALEGLYDQFNDGREKFRQAHNIRQTIKDAKKTADDLTEKIRKIEPEEVKTQINKYQSLGQQLQTWQPEYEAKKIMGVTVGRKLTEESAAEKTRFEGLLRSTQIEVVDLTNETEKTKLVGRIESKINELTRRMTTQASENLEALKKELPSAADLIKQFLEEVLVRDEKTNTVSRIMVPKLDASGRLVVWENVAINSLILPDAKELVTLAGYFKATVGEPLIRQVYDLLVKSQTEALPTVKESIIQLTSVVGNQDQALHLLQTELIKIIEDRLEQEINDCDLTGIPWQDFFNSQDLFIDRLKNQVQKTVNKLKMFKLPRTPSSTSPTP